MTERAGDADREPGEVDPDAIDPDEIDDVDDDPEVPDRRRRGPGPVAALALGALLGAGLVVLALLVAGPRAPGETSPEAGFARDMQVHHAQAVEMAFLLRDRTDDPTMRTIAFDIITTQQQQLGQMYGWLRMWGLPQTSTGPPMGWMSAGGHSGMAPTPVATTGAGVAMPGMASAAQLDALRDARGREAEVLFLRLMIAHHRGGVAMAEAARSLVTDDDVRLLATAIATSQEAEIVQMQQLLDRRGAGST